MCPKVWLGTKILQPDTGTPRGYKYPLPPHRNPSTLSCPTPTKMAYRTTKRGNRSYTRKVTRKGSGGTRRRRSYPTRKRRYSKKMSSKRILNVSSKKKRDVMLQWTNIAANGQVGPFGSGEAILTGNINYMIPWIATARPAVTSNGTGGFPIYEAVRTSSTCYMRGLKEVVSLRSATGDPWKWRRICFRFKGDRIHSLQTGPLRIYDRVEGTDSAGVVRSATNWSGLTQGGAELEQLMFRGLRNLDWVDPWLAPLDTNNISVAYDKTVTLASGNESGFIRNYNRWHPMNKNLTYQDDEIGSGMNVSPWSTQGNRGMGDFYVVDMFKSNGSPEAQLALRYNATLYWHEK